MAHAGGRPTKLTPEMMAKARTFLSEAAKEKLKKTVFTKNGPEIIEVPVPPTITKFSLFLDVQRETLNEWAKENREFSDIFTRVRRVYEQTLVENGLSDNYNPRLSQFLLSADHDKRDKSDVTTDGEKISFQVIDYAAAAKDRNNPI